MSRTLVLRPSAKINLTLRVGPPRGRRLSRRPHAAAVDRALRHADGHARGAARSRSTTRAPGVPADRDQSRLARGGALWRALGRDGEPRDVHVKLDKQIPAAAGLGGGSADAAAALVGAQRGLGRAAVAARPGAASAATLGADVPFFLQGGTALGAGRGDELYPVDDVARLGVVIIKPSFGVSTADAYRWLDEDRAAGVAGRGRPASRDVDLGWPTGPGRAGQRPAGAGGPAPPGGRRDDRRLPARQGALAAAMTGSGSAVFGLFPEAAGADARPGGSSGRTGSCC